MTETDTTTATKSTITGLDWQKVEAFRLDMVAAVPEVFLTELYSRRYDLLTTPVTAASSAESLGELNSLLMKVRFRFVQWIESRRLVIKAAYDVLGESDQDELGFSRTVQARIYVTVDPKSKFARLAEVAASIEWATSMYNEYMGEVELTLPSPTEACRPAPAKQEDRPRRQHHGRRGQGGPRRDRRRRPASADAPNA